MTDCEVNDHIKFAGKQGENTKIESRPNVGQLLHTYTAENQLCAHLSGLPHIKRQKPFVDRLTLVQIKSPLHHEYKECEEQGKDMSAPIGNAKCQLESLRRERDEELARLDEEKHVTPEEPELVTASLVLDSYPRNR